MNILDLGLKRVIMFIPHPKFSTPEKEAAKVADWHGVDFYTIVPLQQTTGDALCNCTRYMLIETPDPHNWCAKAFEFDYTKPIKKERKLGWLKYLCGTV